MIISFVSVLEMTDILPPLSLCSGENLSTMKKISFLMMPKSRETALATTDAMAIPVTPFSARKKPWMMSWGTLSSRLPAIPMVLTLRWVVSSHIIENMRFLKILESRMVRTSTLLMDTRKARVQIKVFSKTHPALPSSLFNRNQDFVVESGKNQTNIKRGSDRWISILKT